MNVEHKKDYKVSLDKLHRNFFDTSSRAQLIINSKGEILEINPFARKILKYNKKATNNLFDCKYLLPIYPALKTFLQSTRHSFNKEFVFVIGKGKNRQSIIVQIEKVIIDTNRLFHIVIRTSYSYSTVSYKNLGILEQKDKQVTILNEFAQEIAEMHNIDEILSKIITLIKEQFGYYYVHVFFMEGNQLRIEKGTGEEGRVLEKQKLSIPVDKTISLIAKAARTKRAVYVKDVNKSTTWLPNKVLPRTKSELSIPIIFKSKVLGVLDIQSEKLDGIEQDIQNLLEGICGQIAIALNNKIAEEELRSSEERYRLLFEIMPEGIVIYSDFKVLFVNPATVRIMGARSKEQLIGKDIRNFVHPDSIPYLKERVEQFLNIKNKPLSFVLKVVRLDNKTIDLEITTRKFEYLGKGVRLAIIRDLTERLKSEKELLLSKRALEAINDGIVLTDPNLENNPVVYINSAYKRITGYSSRKILGSNLNFLQGRDTDRKVVTKIIEAIDSEKNFKDEILNYKKNGKAFWNRLKISPIYNDKKDLINYLGIVEDITKQKQIEDNIKRERRVYRLIAEASVSSGGIAEICEGILHDLIKTLSFDYGTIRLFEKDTQILWPIATIGRTHEEQKKFIFPYDIDRKGHMGAYVARRRQPVYVSNVANSHIPKDIRSRLTRINIKSIISWPLISASGNLIGVIHLSSKAPVEQFSNQDKNFLTTVVDMFTLVLERKIAEKDLIKANKLAETSVKAKEQFLANMTHEIRTPMNAIIGMTHLLFHTSPTVEQLEYLNAMKLSTDNLMVIINDILDLSRIESGKIQLNQLNFSVREILQELEYTFRYKVREKKIEFRLHIDENIPDSVYGDPFRLTQIITNLVNNAIKFTHKGYVEVRVNLIAEIKNTYTLCFKIIDTGIGIRKEKLSSIFESFVQADKEIGVLYGGSGLGLAIVKRLVELNHGVIEVNSRVGKGSVFSVKLKFSKSIKNAGNKAKMLGISTIDNSLKGKRILLVEDNKMNQLVAATIMKKWGIEVDVSSSSKIAINKLLVNEYDLMILDIQMPDVNGYELAEFVRKKMLIGSEKLPILAMTAHVLPEIREKVLKAGMDGYISKPFVPENLFSQILELVNMHKLQIKITNLNFLYKASDSDKNCVKEVISAFLEDVPINIDELHNAIQEADFLKIASLSHKLKGSISYMGMDDVLEKVKEIESKAKTGGLIQEIENVFMEILEQIDIAYEELRFHLSTL